MFCGGGFGGYGFNDPGFMGSGWMFLAIGARVAIFIGLILLAIKLFKNYSYKSMDGMKIINEKFASGEISEEEYLKRKNILSKKD